MAYIERDFKIEWNLLSTKNISLLFNLKAKSKPMGTQSPSYEDDVNFVSFYHIKKNKGVKYVDSPLSSKTMIFNNPFFSLRSS